MSHFSYRKVKLFCFGVIIVIGVAILVWFIYRYLNRPTFQQEETKRAHWQELAAANQLTFVPGYYRPLGRSEPSHVIGTYRDHHFKLDSFAQVDPKEERFYTYTRIRVLVNTDADRLLEQHKKSGLDQPLEVKDVVRQLTAIDLSSSGEQVHTLVDGSEIRLHYEQRGLKTDPRYLQSLFDDLSELADGHARMFALSGKAVPTLVELAQITQLELRDTAIQLLEAIAYDTTKRLGHEAAHLLCPDCLARYGAHRLRLSSLKSITYYGCRICHQSREFKKVWVVAVLDNELETEQFEQGGILQVNWLVRRLLFDFDAIAIARATDEEVERFAIQVGNDTDKLRQPRYQQMRCAVAADCELSENTMRILGSMFGEIITK